MATVVRSDTIHYSSGSFDPIYKDSDEVIVENKSKTLTKKLEELDSTNTTEDTNIANNKYEISQTNIRLDNHIEFFNKEIARLDTKNSEQDAVSEAIRIDLANHKGDTSNPHSVTKAQVGLGNCDNTADTDKDVATARTLNPGRKIHGEIFDGSTDIDFEVLHIGPTEPTDKRVLWVKTGGEQDSTTWYWNGSAWKPTNVMWA